MKSTQAIRDGRSSAGSQPKLKVPIPHEHGAWAILYASFVVGWAAAASLSLIVLLILIATTGLFLAHEPLIKLLRGRRHGARPENLRHWFNWLAIFAVPALAAGLILLLYYRLWLLAIFGGTAGVLFCVHLYLAAQRQDRSAFGELLGIAGLTLTAPGVYAGVEGRVDWTALIVWSLCLLYFGSGVFYVKMRVSRNLKPKEFGSRRSQCLGYHFLVLAILCVLALGLGLPWILLLGFVPILGRAFWHAFRSGGPLNLRRIGYLEVLYTIVFTILTGAGSLISGF